MTPSKPAAPMSSPEPSRVDASRAPLSLPIETPVGVLPTRLDDPSLYLNRELSWLEFNARVLAEALDPSVPLYERLKFLAIFSTNLDEFFMVRAAGLQAQLYSEVEELPPDGLTPEQQLTFIGTRVHELVQESYAIWNSTLRKELRAEDIFARYGGEEFAVIMRGIDARGAAALAERLRAATSFLVIQHGGHSIRVTLSAGCASARELAEPRGEDLVGAADRRLYAAKRAGRNRVVFAD